MSLPALTDLALPALSRPDDVRAASRLWKADGLRVGFVPTMGALHDGHLALIEQALDAADRVIASIFVNPAQFAAHEDLDSYPRSLEADAEKLARAGCDLLYAPTASDMYPEGFSTRILPGDPARGLESAARPHFFGGVATVVAKLFNQVEPDIAVFGEKDYQQLQVIRAMVRDLDLPVRILAGGTRREADGLALSSRNAYLDAAARERAARLNVILSETAAAIETGASPADAVALARAQCAKAFDAVDYVELRDAETLAELDADQLARPARLLAAVRLAGVRLIDNLAVSPARGSTTRPVR